MLRPTFSGLASPIPEKRRLVVHLGRRLHDGDVAVRLVGDLEQLRVYAAQAPAVGLVQKALETSTYCFPCLVIMNSSLTGRASLRLSR